MPGDPSTAAERLYDNHDRRRFELHRDGQVVGWMLYTHLRPNRYALQHTEVVADHQHEGVGSTMLRRVFDEVRQRGGTVTAICPFVADYLARNPDARTLVDSRHPGYADRAAAEAARAIARG
jgi:predicted GNAT family acetyltransferase